MEKSTFDKKISLLADIQIAINHYQQAIDDASTAETYLSNTAYDFLRSNQMQFGLCYFAEKNKKINNGKLFRYMIEYLMAEYLYSINDYIITPPDDLSSVSLPEDYCRVHLYRMDFLVKLQDFVVCCSDDLFNAMISRSQKNKFAIEETNSLTL